MAAIEGLYHQLGWTYGPALQLDMAQWLDDHRPAGHRPLPETYGLTTGEIRELLAGTDG